ncbi:MAG: hypothetical protein SNJ82_00380 [Gemmataceae bacterium]
MSTIAAEKQPLAPKKPQPPEDAFWTRYSPHGEAPLSFAGSMGLHLLMFGLLILLGMYALASQFKEEIKLPVEPVRILPGGGGSPGGDPKAAKGGTGTTAQEDVPDNIPKLPELNLPPKPELTEVQRQNLAQELNAEDLKPVIESRAAPALAALEKSIREKLANGIRAAEGKTGPGSGGGSGSGSGKGIGDQTGDQTVRPKDLTKREKRMLRWHMIFTANSGPEYVAQMRALGAVLAFPVGPDRYQTVRDLKPGAKLLDEDLNAIQRIYWIDDKPASVRDVLAALGLSLSPPPPRFIAFMPEELEKKLFEMEKAYITRVLRVPFNEDKIDETIFRVTNIRGKYVPQLERVTLRR